MQMILAWLRDAVFARKLVDDVRTIEGDSVWTVELPSWLLGKNNVVCGLLPPVWSFYYQLIVLTVLQSFLNAILGACLYKIVVEPRKNSKSAASASASGWIFSFGIALPFLFLEPLWATRALGVRNVGLVMAFLAAPIVNALKVAEAYFGFSPEVDGLGTYVLYFSCLYGMKINAATRAPKPASAAFVWKRLRTLLQDFLFVPSIICVLRPYGYEVFATKTAVGSTDHSLGELFSWQHLVNNFFVACLLSCSLSQSTIGISLLYNIVYGVETYEVVRNPMLKSNSVSDFWGRRWNVLVHTGLKNGVYKPTRKHSGSKLWAVAATFVYSGLLHEYVNYAMWPDDYRRSEWKQIAFFGWNGVLLLLEYAIGRWAVFQWMSRRLPPVIVTALVLCCALPLAHLFTGEYIKHGWFEAVFIAEPVVVCQSRGAMG